LLDDKQTAGILETRPSNWPLIFMDGNQIVDGKQQYDLIRWDITGITERIADKFLASGGKEFICLAYERHMGLSFFTMVKTLKCKLSAAGLSLKNIKIIRCSDTFSDVEQFLDRGQDSLLIAFVHKEIGMLKKVMENKSLSETRLLPAIGFSCSGMPERYSWSLPVFNYDTVKFAAKAVECLLQRIKNPLLAYKHILVSGTADQGDELF